MKTKAPPDVGKSSTKNLYNLPSVFIYKKAPQRITIRRGATYKICQYGYDKLHYKSSEVS